jgi:hypothetical protein
LERLKKITQTGAFASTPLSFVFLFFFAFAFLVRCLEGEAKQPAAQIQKQRACARMTRTDRKVKRKHKPKEEE